MASSINEREFLNGLSEEQVHFIRSVADTLPAIVTITDHLSGEIVFNNRDAMEMLGFDAAEVVAMGHEGRLKLIHPDDLQELKNYYARFNTLPNDKENTIQYRVKNKSGGWIWLDMRGRVFKRDEQGNVIQTMHISQDITSRKKTEEEIISQSRFISQITEIAPDIITVTELPSRGLVYSNNKNLAQHGFSREDLERMTIEEKRKIIHLDDQIILEQYFNSFTNKTKDEDIYTARYRAINKQGQMLTFLVRGKVFQRYEDGSVQSVLNFIQNITDIEKAESEILRLKDEIAKKAEDRYHVLFNSMDEGYCIIRMLYDDNEKPIDWRFIEVNPAFERHSGLSDATGKTICEMVPDIEDKWMKIYGNVAETGESIRFQESSDALNRVLDLYAFRIGNPEERKVAVLFNDITLRERHERKKEFLLMLADALRPLSDPIAIQETTSAMLGHELGADRVMYGELLPDNETMAVNRDWTNEGTHSIVGQYRVDDFGKLFTNALWQGGVSVIDNVMNDPRVPEETYLRMWQPIRVCAAISYALVKQGRFVAAFTVHQKTPRKWTDDEIALVCEVGERTWEAVERARAEQALRESEQQLRELVKQKDEFINIASHELKTPVSSMQVYAEIVKERLEEVGNSDDVILLEKLNKQVERLNILIGNLLDTTRISGGQLQLSPEWTDFNQLVHERIEEIQHTTDHDIKFTIVDIPELAIDQERIGQVITNLLSNAIKYSPAGSSIYVTTELVAEGVKLSVSNEGYGIAKEHQEKIFERFFRISSHNMDTFAGMGLGLYISRQIIHRLGGTIGVESEPNKNTVFWFIVPAPYKKGDNEINNDSGR